MLRWALERAGYSSDTIDPRRRSQAARRRRPRLPGARRRRPGVAAGTDRRIALRSRVRAAGRALRQPAAWPGSASGTRAAEDAAVQDGLRRLRRQRRVASPGPQRRWLALRALPSGPPSAARRDARSSPFTAARGRRPVGSSTTTPLGRARGRFTLRHHGRAGADRPLDRPRDAAGRVRPRGAAPHAPARPLGPGATALLAVRRPPRPAASALAGATADSARRSLAGAGSA